MIKTIKELGSILSQEISNRNKKTICLNDYKYILKKYNGTDWKEFLQINPYYYNKCKVYNDPLFDIVIITWDNLQSSKIHNHANNGCIFKIISGNLTEIMYKPDNLKKPYKFSNVKQDEVRYIDNKIGYHKIKNNDQITVSLHIYSPPKFNTKYY